MKRLITAMLTACLLCSCAPRTAAPQDMDTGLERSAMPGSRRLRQMGRYERVYACASRQSGRLQCRPWYGMKKRNNSQRSIIVRRTGANIHGKYIVRTLG